MVSLLLTVKVMALYVLLLSTIATWQLKHLDMKLRESVFALKTKCALNLLVEGRGSPEDWFLNPNFSKLPGLASSEAGFLDERKVAALGLLTPEALLGKILETNLVARAALVSTPLTEVLLNVSLCESVLLAEITLSRNFLEGSLTLYLVVDGCICNASAIVTTPGTDRYLTTFPGVSAEKYVCVVAVYADELCCSFNYSLLVLEQEGLSLSYELDSSGYSITSKEPANMTVYRFESEGLDVESNSSTQLLALRYPRSACFFLVCAARSDGSYGLLAIQHPTPSTAKAVFAQEDALSCIRISLSKLAVLRGGGLWVVRLTVWWRKLAL